MGGGRNGDFNKSQNSYLDLLQGFEETKGKHIGLCVFNSTSPLRPDPVVLRCIKFASLTLGLPKGRPCGRRCSVSEGVVREASSP